MEHSLNSDKQLALRLAHSTDCPAIAAVLLAAFQEVRDQYTEPAFAATVLSADQIAVRMTEGQVWVAVSEGEIVGTVAGKAQGRDYYIRGMAVLPAARKQRIGLRLLQEVEAYASAEGYDHLLLSTTPYLKRAISLYENFGFYIVNDPPHELGGTPLFTMRKKLS